MPRKTMRATNLPGRYFEPLSTSAELPTFRLHDLRHTCDTILLMAGENPRYVQERFACANIPLYTYSRIIEGMDGGPAATADTGG
jgi:integrase